VFRVVGPVIAVISLLLVGCGDPRARAQRSLLDKGIPLRADQINAAVAHGDEETLQQLLTCGVFSEQHDDAGKTPLLVACERSDFRLVRLLVQHSRGIRSPQSTTERGGPLATAALHGDIAIAKLLLQHGANPNARMDDGQPLLLWCIQHGRYIIADALLSHQADFHVHDRAGNNAIAYAFEKRQRALVEHLLELGADPGRAVRSEQAFTPVAIRCLELGWQDLLPQLVKRGADLRAKDAQGSSILDYAIARDDPQQLSQLFDLGLDPNATLADGRTLFLWSLTREESMSLRLLEKGADPNTRDAQGVSVLAHAIDQYKRALCDALLSRGASAKDHDVATSTIPPLICRATEQGWLELLEPLIQRGADVNATTAQGHTAATLALEQGKVEAFQLLVKLGAKPPQSTWSEFLYAAITQAKQQQLATLLAAGIRPAQGSEQETKLLRAAMQQPKLTVLSTLLENHIRTPALFHEACAAGRVDALPLLEKNGVSHDPALDPQFDHPLHLAIQHGRISVLEYLLQKPHDIHALGKEQQTPLACAIARRRLAIVQLLLRYHADPNRPLQPKANAAFLSLFPDNGMRWYLTFDRNITPLMLAADRGEVEIARTLMDHGAKLNAWTVVNKTWPLNFACRKADVPMMRLMLRKNPYIETRKIIVDLAKQEARLYDVCENLMYSTKISTGKKGYSTPKGTYVITNKHRTWHSNIYDGASMPCFQRLSCGAFGFHQGIVPGYPASHGCLRVPYGNAQKLFELTEVGDRVIIE
jgi:ankyrin repeat protein